MIMDNAQPQTNAAATEAPKRRRARRSVSPPQLPLDDALSPATEAPAAAAVSGRRKRAADAGKRPAATPRAKKVPAPETSAPAELAVAAAPSAEAATAVGPEVVEAATPVVEEVVAPKLKPRKASYVLSAADRASVAAMKSAARAAGARARKSDVVRAAIALAARQDTAVLLAAIVELPPLKAHK